MNEIQARVAQLQPSASILARLLVNESSFRTREPARSRFHRDRSAIERYRSFRRMVLLHIHPSVVYTRRRSVERMGRIFWIVWF